MSKQRLVNKDKLIAFIKSNGFVCANALETFPEVDAVPVVRCGECIFYGCGPFGKGCSTMFDGRAAVIPKEPTDYCSYGERQESEVSE